MSPDLEIADGDFVVADSETQELQNILSANQGEWRQFPLIGFGMSDWLLSPLDMAKFRKDVGLQLRLDGFKKYEVILEDGQLTVTGER